MATQVQGAGWSYRLGRAARRALRGYSRSEKQMAGWLASNGLPEALAFGAVWAIRFSIAGVLLYAAFWVAVVVVVGLGAAWYAQQDTSSDDGDLGVHTAWDEIRNNPGYDPLPYEDIEHPNYPHELNN